MKLDEKQSGHSRLTSSRRAFFKDTFVALALAANLALAGCTSLATHPLGFGRDDGWVSTWSTGPQVPAADVPSFNNQTLRIIVHTTLGGDQVRVRLSNRFGTQPLAIGAAHAGLRASGAASITIPVGALAVSDPVELVVPAAGDLAVSVYISRSASPATIHALALQASYVSEAGNFTTSYDAAAFGTAIQFWPFLTGVEVRAGSGARSVVTFGDSITDGFKSTTEANSRWPDHFTKRLLASGRKIAVVNAGISGNRLLHDAPAVIPRFGPNGLARFDGDVLMQTGATHLVVLLGINDIGIPGARNLPEQQVSTEQIISGYRQLIARARAQGIKVIGCTLTPFDTYSAAAGYYTPEGEAKRQAVNTWIRTSKVFDGVIDFDAAVRDPAHPSQFLTGYDSGDHLHPNDAGYKAMADAVDLALFD